MVILQALSPMTLRRGYESVMAAARLVEVIATIHALFTAYLPSHPIYAWTTAHLMMCIESEVVRRTRIRHILPNLRERCRLAWVALGAILSIQATIPVQMRYAVRIAMAFCMIHVILMQLAVAFVIMVMEIAVILRPTIFQDIARGFQETGTIVIERVVTRVLDQQEEERVAAPAVYMLPVSMPRLASEQDTHISCTVCQGDICEGDTVRTLPCDDKHTFHVVCVDPWISQHNTCPNCRAPVIPGDDDQDDDDDDQDDDHQDDQDNNDIVDDDQDDDNDHQDDDQDDDDIVDDD